MADENTEPQGEIPANDPIIEQMTPDADASTEKDESGNDAPAGEEASAPENDGTSDDQSDEDDKKPKRSAFSDRIGELTRLRKDAERKAAALEAELAAIRKGVGTDEFAPDLTSPEAFQKAVQAEAAKLSQQTEYQKRAQSWVGAGRSEFKDFDDRCNVLADLGAADRPEFMELVTDPEIIPDGHKVVALLAENPDEAARILRLDGPKMAAALAKFALSAPKPQAQKLSNAPKPITPIDSVSRGSDERTGDEDMKEYARKYYKKQESRNRGARF